MLYGVTKCLRTRFSSLLICFISAPPFRFHPILRITHTHSAVLTTQLYESSMTSFLYIKLELGPAGAKEIGTHVTELDHSFMMLP
jgi:hypothetical protein